MPMLPPLRNAEDLHAIERVPLDERDVPSTTWEIVRQAAAQRPDAVATTWIPDPARLDRSRVLTAGDLAGQVTATANGLRRAGIARDEAVGFVSPNTGSLFTGMLAAQAIAIAMPINPAFEPDRVGALLQTAGARSLVAAGPEFDASAWERLLDSAGRLGVRRLFALRPDLAAGPAPALGGRTDVAVAYLDDVRDDGRPDALDAPPPAGSDIAAYFHTGGTTGTPKIAAHTHRNETVMAWSIAVATAMDERSAILAGLPLFHVNGLLVTGLAPLVAGARSVWPGPLGWRDPALIAQAWRIVERHGITTMSAVPTVYARLAAVPVDADIRTLTTPIVGAGALPPAVEESFAGHTGVPLLQGYGLTEASCASSFTPHGAAAAGVVGQRLPYQRIATVADGEVSLVAAGTPGEVLISGPTVFAGYVRAGGRELDTGSIVDGWLYTGDIGVVDDAERLLLRGRSKDLIIRGGHNLDPQVIEDALLAHPSVSAAAAVGAPHPEAGEVPVAYVTVLGPVPGDELLGWAAAHVDEPAARPVRVEIVDEVPLTAIGKVFKPALRARAVATAVTDELRAAGLAEVHSAVEVVDGTPVVRLEGTDRDLLAARSALSRYAIRIHDSGLVADAVETAADRGVAS